VPSLLSFVFIVPPLALAQVESSCLHSSAVVGYAKICFMSVFEVAIEWLVWLTSVSLLVGLSLGLLGNSLEGVYYSNLAFIVIATD